MRWLGIGVAVVAAVLFVVNPVLGALYDRLDNEPVQINAGYEAATASQVQRAIFLDEYGAGRRHPKIVYRPLPGKHQTKFTVPTEP